MYTDGTFAELFARGFFVDAPSLATGERAKNTT